MVTPFPVKGEVLLFNHTPIFAPLLSAISKRRLRLLISTVDGDFMGRGLRLRLLDLQKMTGDVD